MRWAHIKQPNFLWSLRGWGCSLLFDARVILTIRITFAAVTVSNSSEYKQLTHSMSISSSVAESTKGLELWTLIWPEIERGSLDSTCCAWLAGGMALGKGNVGNSYHKVSDVSLRSISSSPTLTHSPSMSGAWSEGKMIRQISERVDRDCSWDKPTFAKPGGSHEHVPLFIRKANNETLPPFNHQRWLQRVTPSANSASIPLKWNSGIPAQSFLQLYRLVGDISLLVVSRSQHCLQFDLNQNFRWCWHCGDLGCYCGLPQAVF